MPAFALLAAAAFALCPPEGRRTTCVVDGDTFWIAGEKVRIADINAPEVDHARCAAELAAGRRATGRLTQLLNAGPLTLSRQGTDRYGRALATVTAGGVAVGRQLVAEGFAERWGGARIAWCRPAG